MKKGDDMDYIDRFFKDTVPVHKEKYDSYYDKSLSGHIWLYVKYEAMLFLTMGFAYPWAAVMKFKSLHDHKVICGKRLKFIGDPIELLSHWIWWWLLGVVTVGLYGIVAKHRIEQWITANTVFEEVYQKELLPEEIVTETKKKSFSWRRKVKMPVWDFDL